MGAPTDFMWWWINSCLCECPSLAFPVLFSVPVCSRYSGTAVAEKLTCLVFIPACTQTARLLTPSSCRSSSKQQTLPHYHPIVKKHLNLLPGRSARAEATNRPWGWYLDEYVQWPIWASWPFSLKNPFTLLINGVIVILALPKQLNLTVLLSMITVAWTTYLQALNPCAHQNFKSSNSYVPPVPVTSV